MADRTIVFMGFINQQTSLGGTILYGFIGICLLNMEYAWNK
jgi:hypothetical protein